MLRRIVADRWFATLDLLLVMISGAAWVLIPEVGIWFTLVALLPWMLRLLLRQLPFQRTPFDLLIAIFLITAWVGYWAAYDKPSAWIKVWLIVTSVLLYFALSSQPVRNLQLLSLGSFCIGLGVSIYFFLTHDFGGSPGGIWAWWMDNRPLVDWPAVHHGYISGLLVIMNLFAGYWLWNAVKKTSDRFSLPLKALLVLAMAMVVSAFILTMSRGIWAATACGLGIGILWKVVTANRFKAQPSIRSSFPMFVIAYLSIIIAFVYLGPARAGGQAMQSAYGNNTRAEVHERGIYILEDYPLTGGGLGSFPGLYSQYMLSIPFFYFINSYNMFLDVAIEQGLIGGVSVALIYFGSVSFISSMITKSQSDRTRFFSWLALFALIVTIVHGLFYDYLYNGIGTMLLLFPVGLAMIAVREPEYSADGTVQVTAMLPRRSTVMSRVALRVLFIGLFMILALNSNKVLSLGYSNLGAVQMSQVELRDFPRNQWAAPELFPELDPAVASLHMALEYDPDNQTANYRLGMISMLRQDFETAALHLERAYHEAPGHRGIIKSLGYAYLWLGEMDKAQLLLERIPEAQSELDTYVWWWGTQNRHDLSINAQQMASRLHAQGYSTGNE